MPTLPAKKYSIIYADPPWSFRVWNKATGSGRSATQHYATMTWDELYNLPVVDLAGPNCALFLWVVPPSLPDCIKVAEHWGFQYKTKAFCWVKTTKHGKDHFGLGYYTRANSEDCLLFTRGEMPAEVANVRQLQRTEDNCSYALEELPITIEAQHIGHSVKPQIFRDEIVRLFGERRTRIELFHRGKFDSRYDAWGDFGYSLVNDREAE